MIRRLALAVAAAVALILVPSAAMAAYQAPGFTFTVSDATPAIGVPFTAVVTGAEPGTVVTLTVTGGQTFTATANASGVATFTLTLSAAGVYTLTATNAAGVVIGTQTVTVAAAGAGSGAPALSTTGFDGLPLAVGGGLLVLTGAGAVVISRRRRSAQVPA